MEYLYELLRSIIATPFVKLRTLLKKSHEGATETDDVSEGVVVKSQSKCHRDRLLASDRKAIEDV